MQKLMIFSAVALLAASASAPAWAQAGKPFRGEARLVAAVAAPTQTTVEGVTWSCTADACVGEAKSYRTLDSVMKECRKVSAALGPLASYTSRGKAFSAINLKVCNKAATVQTAAN